MYRSAWAINTRDVTLDKRTTFADADGISVTVGSKPIVGQLTPGDEVLVTHDEQADDLKQARPCSMVPVVVHPAFANFAETRSPRAPTPLSR